MKIKDAMQKEVIKFQSDDRIIDVAQSLRKNNISGAPVVNEENHLVGIISEGDIMRLLEIHSPKINLILPAPLDLIELPVRMKHEFDEIAEDMERASSVIIGEIMTHKVITIKREATINDAAELMDKNDVKRLPVIDDNGKLVGIVTRGDIIAAMVSG
ncbi:MAG TPA: CBS domain-containing protein [Methanobacteriaceae archaeon]|nr:CBS domain-containing protein [Methanobacteriaceae archaeon]